VKSCDFAIGRYVLLHEIFESQAINPGYGGEIQLTEAPGFLKATVEYALRRHDLGDLPRARKRVKVVGG
jgi:UTP-glucose-1-phosphate uridylyltransferase